MGTNSLSALLSALLGPSLITAPSFSLLVRSGHTHTHTHTHTHKHTHTVVALLPMHICTLQLIEYAFSTALLFSTSLESVWPPVTVFSGSLKSPNLRRRWLRRYCCRWQLASHIIGLSTCHSLSLMFPLVQNTGLGGKESTATSIIQLRVSKCPQPAVFTWQNLTAYSTWRRWEMFAGDCYCRVRFIPPLQEQ